MNIVFDIGGTNMRVASAEGNELKEIRKVPTPQDPKEGIATLGRIAKELSGGQIEQAAGGVPSTVDSDGRMTDAPHLPQWQGMNIVDMVSRELGTGAHVFNDTAVIGYGELKQGAGKGFASIAYITVSTGVGGTFMADVDFAQREVLGIGFPALKRSLESQISGTAIAKKFGIHPRELDSIEERNKLADILAAGLAEIFEKWKPDAFVLGGSMITGMNPIPLERVQETLATLMENPPAIKMAELGDEGGLRGALRLLQS